MSHGQPADAFLANPLEYPDVENPFTFLRLHDFMRLTLIQLD